MKGVFYTGQDKLIDGQYSSPVCIIPLDYVFTVHFYLDLIMLVLLSMLV